jgi:hypothetical protein
MIQAEMHKMLHEAISGPEHAELLQMKHFHGPESMVPPDRISCERARIGGEMRWVPKDARCKESRALEETIRSNLKGLDYEI